MTLRLPLAIYNSGAKARTVDDLQLFVPSWKGGARFQWEHIAETIDPRKGTELTQDFPAPFAIDPRRVESRNVDFTYEFPGNLPKVGATLIVLQARLDGRDAWDEVGRVTLHVGHMSHPEAFIAYRNTLTLCTGETDEGTSDRWARHLDVARG